MEVAIISSGDMKIPDTSLEQVACSFQAGSMDGIDSQLPVVEEQQDLSNNYSEIELATEIQQVCDSSEQIEVHQDDKGDQKILAVLREIARKCTNANPMKRPTSCEVLKMLEGITPLEISADFSAGSRMADLSRLMSLKNRP